MKVATSLKFSDPRPREGAEDPLLKSYKQPENQLTQCDRNESDVEVAYGICGKNEVVLEDCFAVFFVYGW